MNADEWFDSQCKVARRNIRWLLDKFRHSLHTEDRHAFCIARREYKDMLKRKKEDFNAILFGQIDIINEESERLLGKCTQDIV